MQNAWDSPEAQWVREGSELFANAVSRLGDSEWQQASLLPGWTRAHVTAHVAANAQAIGRLLRWARTGERTPMYASREERDREIEQGAAMDPGDIRAWWERSNGDVLAAFAALPSAAWDSMVVTAQGLEVPALETLWMRSREVNIHAVDLGNGVTFEDLPAGFLDRLIDEVANKHAATWTGPPVTIGVEGGRTWSLDGSGETTDIVGSRGAIACWLTGRGASGIRLVRGTGIPELGKWL